jgi:hypothetical protein
MDCPFFGKKARKIAWRITLRSVILRCRCSDTDIEMTASGLSKLLAMQDPNERVDVLLRAVRLASPGERPVIHSECF